MDSRFQGLRMDEDAQTYIIDHRFRQRKHEALYSIANDNADKDLDFAAQMLRAEMMKDYSTSPVQG